MAFRAIVVVVSLCAAGAAWAGPLTPPAGPVISTPGPEPRIAINATNTPGDADSIFRISQPGSYYLTGNITGVAAKHGIEIAAANVTLDLMGFEIRGVVGSLDGVSAIGVDIDNVTVRNGSVTNWGGDGLDLTATSGTSGAVMDIVSGANGGVGIIATFNSVIARCVIASNGSNGISSQYGCTITNCTVYSNSGDGISAAGSSSITNCSAQANGIYGIEASDGSIIANCSATDNGVDGFRLNTGSTVSACGAHNNNGCGIRTNDGCTITDCALRGNQLDGIYVTDSCIVIHNTCSLNGSGGVGAGIHVIGIDNRIEANNCITADYGIDVDSGGNFIARNTCSGNTTFNWAIAANNVCLVVQAVSGVAFNGDTGGSSPGSTNPSANYTY